MPTATLTDNESACIVQALAPRFKTLVEGYDARKYPASAYDGLLRAFADPASVTGGDVRRALEWKYGHWGKANYPQQHRTMAERVWASWPVFCGHLTTEPKSVFDFWTDALHGRSTDPFITVTFLLHLLQPGLFPIMDQHTFRAMNALMKALRPDWTSKRKPSNYNDLLLYKAFFDALHAAWPPDSGVPRCDLDKALMVYGQEIK